MGEKLKKVPIKNFKEFVDSLPNIEQSNAILEAVLNAVKDVTHCKSFFVAISNQEGITTGGMMHPQYLLLTIKSIIKLLDSDYGEGYTLNVLLADSILSKMNEASSIDDLFNSILEDLPTNPSDDSEDDL